MRKLLQLLVLLMAAALPALAQGPAALQSASFTATGSGSAIPLLNTGISLHRIYWRTQGTVTTCTVAADSSADGITWNAGAVITGQTCTANGVSTVASANVNFVRVTVTTLTGGGTVTVTYVGNPDTGSSVQLSPCSIQNTVCLPELAFGVASSDALTNNTNFFLSATGAALALGVYPYWFNGTTWDRAFYCPNTTFISALGAATTQIVAPVAGKKVRICSIVMTNNNATATTVKLVEGTGANCGTGQSNLTGIIGDLAAAPASQSIGMSSGGGFTTNVTGDGVCVTGSAAGSVDVTISFDQH